MKNNNSAKVVKNKKNATKTKTNARSYRMENATVQVNAPKPLTRSVISYREAVVTVDLDGKVCVVTPQKYQKSHNTKIFERMCVKCLDRPEAGRYRAYIEIEAESLKAEQLEIQGVVQDMFEAVLAHYDNLQKGGETE